MRSVTLCLCVSISMMPSRMPSMVPLRILLCAVILVLARTCDGKPLMRWMDTAVVESTVRESIARAPTDLLLAATEQRSASGNKKGVAGGGGKHGKGFHHKSSTEGNDGYKQFDAFHTKSGDKYGYEEHSSFGKQKKGKSGGQKHYSSGGGAKDKYAKDGYGAASHVDVFKTPAQLASGPKFQSLKDVSGDAFTVDGAKYKRGLHDDDGDLFFVFSAEGNQDGQQGENAQQQEGDDEGSDDDGEAAEQQEDDDDYEGGGGQQQQQQQADDDYDY